MRVSMLDRNVYNDEMALNGNSFDKYIILIFSPLFAIILRNISVDEIILVAYSISMAYEEEAFLCIN